MTECCTITPSNLVHLCVCFLRLKKQRFLGTISKYKYQTVCFSLFLRYMLIVIIPEIAKFALRIPCFYC